MTQPLTMAVETAGRVHVLDLVRKLRTLAQEVKLYSFVPPTATRMHRLHDECHVSVLPFAASMLVWNWMVPRLAPSMREERLYAALNSAAVPRPQASFSRQIIRKVLTLSEMQSSFVPDLRPALRV